MKITVKVSREVAGLLSVLGDPKAVVGRLIDHAQQGVYRPGAWERQWLCQAFGDDWQAKLVGGDPYGVPGYEHIFQKPAPKQKETEARP